MPATKGMAPATTDAIQKVAAAKPFASGQQHTPRPPTDLLAMPSPVWDGYLTGRQDGFLEGESVGFARGYQACDDEISTLQREAAKVVLLMAGVDPHEVAQTRRRQRQVETAERHAQASQPWPAEATS